MPFNPGEFVYQPRPLQQFDFGQGFRDLIEARLGKRRADLGDAQLDEQRLGRADTNTRFAAELASARNKEEYDKILAKYQQGVAAAEAGRTAWSQGQLGAVEALSPRIRETGGSVTRIPSARPGGLPSYDIHAPDRPEAPPLDIQGMRNQIFGGGPPAAAPGRNPMDPPSVPGLSAAQLPPAPPQPQPPATSVAPPPYPGREGMGPPPPPGAAPPDAPANAAPPPGAELQPEGQMQQPGSLQLTPPNPLNPPAFSPYLLDTDQLLAQNRARVEPYLRGFQKGVPPEYQSRLNEFNSNVVGLGLPPEETLKLVNPALTNLTGLMKANINAQNASASLGLRGQAMENTRNERLMRNAQTRIEAASKRYDLPNSIKNWTSASEVEGLLDQMNGQADTLAISQIRNFYQDGVMTDKDFQDVKDGATRTWMQAIKEGTFEALVGSTIHPDVRRHLIEIAKMGERNARRRIGLAQDQMMTTLLNPRTSSQEERDYTINAIAPAIPQELWHPKIAEWMGIPMAQKSGAMDQSGNFPVQETGVPPAASENLGVHPLPGAGKPAKGSKSVSFKISAGSKGPTVNINGKEKSVKDLTQEELDSLPVEALEKLLNGVKPDGAP